MSYLEFSRSLECSVDTDVRQWGGVSDLVVFSVSESENGEIRGIQNHSVAPGCIVWKDPAPLSLSLVISLAKITRSSVQSCAGRRVGRARYKWMSQGFNYSVCERNLNYKIQESRKIPSQLSPIYLCKL